MNIILFPLNKITSLTCFDLLICYDAGYLKKPYYRSHTSDPMLPSNEHGGIKVTMKVL